MGKLTADLFWNAGAGDMVSTVPVRGQNVAVHEWRPYGAIAIGRVGATVLAVGGASPAEVAAALAKEPLVWSGKFVTTAAKPYPRGMDFYDLRAFKFYTESMTSTQGMGLDSHWQFVHEFSPGGLSFQQPNIADSNAPGESLWCGPDYEVREAERQGGIVTPSVQVAGAMPLWMRSQFPAAIAQPNPDALMIGWQMPALSNTYCQSWGAPLDLQRRYALSFLDQVIDRYGKSPAVGGWQFYAGEPGVEFGYHDRTTENLDYSPEGETSFRNYLRNVKGYSLAELGARWFGDPKHFASWTQVTIPDLHGFYGNLNAGCYKIDRGWSWLPKDQAASSTAIPTAAADWLPVEMPPSEQQVTLPQPDAYYRVDFDTAKWSAAHAGKNVYLVCDPNVRNVKGTHVWLNGADLGEHKAADGGVGPFSLDVTGQLRSEANELVLLVPREGKIIGPVFLTTTKPEPFPYLGAQRNAQYVDTKMWQPYCLYSINDSVFREARRLDPDRPLCVAGFPVESMSAELPRLAQDYGVSFQNTGREAFYAPWIAGFGCVNGYYSTSEPGGTPSEPDLTRMLSWILFDGDSSTMLYQNIESFEKLEQQTGWFSRHKSALNLEGKALRVKAPIALFRSSTTTLLGDISPWNWDIGRGELQSAHFDNVYVGESEIQTGKADAYPVIFDCASRFIDNSTIEAIRRYVEAGGTFVALQNTGWHTTTEPDSYPISRLTGFSVLSNKAGGTVKFGNNLPILDAWAGKAFDGAGSATDWQGKNQTGNGLSLKAAAPDAVTLATWSDGSTALGYRKLGKGRVIVLGSSFWRNGRDISGVWHSQSDLERAFFDRLFTDLGVVRNATSDSRDIWTRKYVTKNGLQDWLIAMNSISIPVTSSVSMAVESEPAQVWDVESGASVPFTYANGMVTIPHVTIADRENKVFAVRRADLADGIPTWWDEKLRYWQRSPQSSGVVGIASDDVLTPSDPAGMATVVADQWKFTTAASNVAGDAAWKLPGFDDAAWRTIGNGPWNLQIPELKDYVGAARYRLQFQPPASWSGHRITLNLRGVHVPVVYGHGEFALNGQRVATYDFSVHDGELYNYDVTGEIKPGVNVLSLEVTSTKGYGGTAGAIWLAPEPVLAAPQDLAGQWSMVGEDRKTVTSVSFPGQVHGRYVYRDFDLPASDTGKNVYLHIESPYQWLGLIMVNGHPLYFNCMGTAFGTRTDINLAPFFKAGETNRIGLWPFATEPRYQGNEANQQADMNISAIRIGLVTESQSGRLAARKQP